VFFLQDFHGVDQLGREDLETKIKVKTCGGADIGIVWAPNADILLPKFAGTTPTLNTFGFRVRGNTSVKVRLVEQIPTADGFVIAGTGNGAREHGLSISRFEWGVYLATGGPGCP
jgi:hypothetical protein